MVDAKTIQKQLKKLKFGGTLWNQAELRELPKIIHKDENISECVNGIYEGGVALLVATEMRVLLIDKKPFNFLTVEDLRFDMINEIDYSHRLIGATITISTGSKTLKFTSLNQPRLRNLINLVQEHMSQHKKSQTEKLETQQQHLEEINKQLQMYLLAQHQQLQQAIGSQQPKPQAASAELPKPDPKLSDYLFAQRLLEKFYQENGEMPPASETENHQLPANTSSATNAQLAPVPPPTSSDNSDGDTDDDLVRDARREVFGTAQRSKNQPASEPTNTPSHLMGIEINPLRIAYSKLPMMLRNRKFGRPSLHDHSRQQRITRGQTAPSSS